MKKFFVFLFVTILCITTLVGTGCDRAVRIISPMEDSQEVLDGEKDDITVMDTGDISGHIPRTPVILEEDPITDPAPEDEDTDQ